MAVRTSRVCDINADHKGEAEQHTFGADEKYFTGDFCEDDATKLTAALEPFVKVGTPVSAKDMLKGTGNGAGTYDPMVVRAWAARNGKQVGDRGRIPADIVAEWRADTGQ